MIVQSAKTLAVIIGCVILIASNEPADTVRAPDTDSVTTDTISLPEAVDRPDSNLIVTIETGSFSELKSPEVDTLDIIFNCNRIRFAGSSLRIAIDATFYDIVEILPGSLVDSCQWQMFSTRPMEQTGLDRNFAVWQIMALADSPSGGEFKGLYGYDGSDSFARIVISREHTDQHPSASVPIFFLWSSCRDNLISGRYGKILLVSDTVEHAFPPGIPLINDDFPTTNGTPSSCIRSNIPNAPRPIVVFRSGGLEFKSVLD